MLPIDWGAVAVTAVALLTGIVGFMAATGRLFKDRRDDRVAAEDREETRSTDRTVDAVFRLVEQLQEETGRLHARILILEGTVETQSDTLTTCRQLIDTHAETIRALRREIETLRAK